MDAVARKTVKVNGEPVLFVLVNKFVHRTSDPLYRDIPFNQLSEKPKRRHIGYDWKPEGQEWTEDLEAAVSPMGWPTDLAAVKEWADWFSSKYEERIKA